MNAAPHEHAHARGLLDQDTATARGISSNVNPRRSPPGSAYLSTLILHPFQKASALRALIWREVSMEKLTPFTQQ